LKVGCELASCIIYAFMHLCIVIYALKLQFHNAVVLDTAMASGLQQVMQQF